MTITTIRPVSDDVIYGSITKSPNVAAWQNIDDAPADDGTYVTSASYGSGAAWGLADITLSAGQRVKQCKMRTRGFHNSADVGHADFIDVRFRDPVTNKLSAVSTMGTYSNTVVALESGFYITDPNGKAWTETVVDRLQVTAAWRARDTGITQFRLTELYVDVDIHSQLVVSAVTVTGNTTTTMPSFSWTLNSDPDGDAQTRWQAIVYSSVQYSAGGFIAGTTAGVWNSGVQNGSASSGIVGTNLVNGTTYKVYMRVAKDWPGPQGPIWWSDWVASSAFTESLTPPAAPGLTAVIDSGLPQYRVMLRLTSSINLVTQQQSSGEDTTTTGWAAGSNTTLTNIATTSADGVRMFNMASAAAGTISAEMNARQRVEPFGVYSAGADFRTAVTGRTTRVSIRFYTVAGTLISTLTGTSTTPTDTTGGFVTAKAENVTAPFNAYDASVLVEVLATGAAAENHRFDKVGLNAGATFGWMLGGYEGPHSFEVLRSLRVSPTIGRSPGSNWIHPQLFSAGGLTTATDGFYPRQAQDVVRQMPMDQAPPESPIDVSAGMIEWTIYVGSFSYLDIGTPGGGALTDGTHPYALVVVPALPMTFEVWMKASGVNSGTPGNYTCRLFIAWTDAFGNAVGSPTNTTNLTVTTTLQQFSVTGTPPTGAVFAHIEVENTNGTNAIGSRVYFIMPRWRRAAIAATDDWPGQVFAWNWETVRINSALSLPDGKTSITVFDHEPPSDRPIIYAAKLITANSTGDAVASDLSSYVNVYMPPPARAILKDPFQPENAAIVNVWPGDSMSQTEDSTEFHPSGRDDDPVFVRSWRGETVSYELSALSDLEYYRLIQLLPSSRPLLFQWTEGGQTYVRVTAWSATRTRPGYYKSVTVSGARTARPM